MMAQMNPMGGPLPPMPPPPGMPPADDDSAGPDAQDMMPPGPLETSVDPDSLAGVIAQAIASARQAGHAQLDDMQDQAAQAAQAHPVVQAMMQPPPDPAMSGTAGGALPPVAGPPPGMGPM